MTHIRERLVVEDVGSDELTMWERNPPLNQRS